MHYNSETHEPMEKFYWTRYTKRSVRVFRVVVVVVVADGNGNHFVSQPRWQSNAPNHAIHNWNGIVFVYRVWRERERSHLISHTLIHQFTVYISTDTLGAHTVHTVRICRRNLIKCTFIYIHYYFYIIVLLMLIYQFHIPSRIRPSWFSAWYVLQLDRQTEY